MSPRFAIRMTIAVVASVAGLTLSSVPSQAVNIVPCNTGRGAQFAGGSGTPGSPYLIANQAQLQVLSNNTDIMDCNFKLTSNIALTITSGTSTPKFGTLSDQFTGDFDGDGHSISGISVTASGSGGYVGGLIDVSGEATIKNLTVTGTVSALNWSNVGGLIGMADQGTTISNVHAHVDVTAASSAGGLAGSAMETTIEKSSATGSVTATSGMAAGLAGYFRGYYNGVHAIIRDSFATGTVIGGSASNAIAGLVGGLSQGTGEIRNSFATGSVSGGSESAFNGMYTSYGSHGGLIASWYATASGPTPYNTGAGTPLVVSNSPWNTQSTGQSASADGLGTGATTAAMKSLATYSDPSWSIGRGYQQGKTWGICVGVNSGYPFLTGEYASDPCPHPHATSISTTSGSTAGGTSIVIAGSDFVDVSSVKFGTVDAATFTVTNSSQIVAVSPAHVAGDVDIVITDSLDQSATLNSAFRFEAPPSAVQNPSSAPTQQNEQSGATPSGTQALTPDVAHASKTSILTFGGKSFKLSAAAKANLLAFIQSVPNGSTATATVRPGKTKAGKQRTLVLARAAVVRNFLRDSGFAGTLSIGSATQAASSKTTVLLEY